MSFFFLGFQKLGILNVVLDICNSLRQCCVFTKHWMINILCLALRWPESLTYIPQKHSVSASMCQIFFFPSLYLVYRVTCKRKASHGSARLSQSCQLKWDSGIGLSTTGILTLISYLLPLLPFYMAASRDDISASTAVLAEGFLNPAVGGTCVHSCFSPGQRGHGPHTPLTLLLPQSHRPKERRVKVKAQADVLMVIAKQKGVKTGSELKKKKHVFVVSVVTVRARSTCLSAVRAPPYLLLLSGLLANCDICS